MLHKTVNLEDNPILITGAVGFIGSNLVMEFMRTVPGIKIVGLDSMNDYYDVAIKELNISCSIW